MRLLYLLLLAVSLAGPTLALTVTIGGNNVTAPDLVTFDNDQFLSMADCTSQCAAARNQLNCGNDQCTCSDATGAALLNCEQCLFTYLVDTNIAPPDPWMGAQRVLSAFVTACQAPPVNITIKPLQLALPPSWDGSESLKLGKVATVIAVAAGSILGGGSLYILSTIE